MAIFMDIHRGMNGITQDQLDEAHRKDLEIEAKEGVHFIKAWADPATGQVFCLSEAPNKEAVQRVHTQAGHAATEVVEIAFTTE